jgi:radial spoke head protein 3
LSRHTPEPVEGRKHIPVQTELYLEELSDRVEEVDVDVQTDEFLDRPPSPLFIPAKTGVDVSTQIYDGDLFDFNIEVKPILEVLVGKTIEQSLLEVMEEEELADLRKQQREYEELRNAEKVEQQRLEEQERRLTEEKHRRMKQAADVLRLEKETAEKLAAKAFAKSYLADLVPSVFNNLRNNGYFYDPVHRDLETGFIPWILETTASELNSNMLGRLLLDHLIRNVVKQRDLDYKNIENIIMERMNNKIALNIEEEQVDTNENNEAQPPIDDSIEPTNQNENDEAQQETSNQQDEVNFHLNQLFKSKVCFNNLFIK